MDTEDGRLFIKHLAYYVHTHEKALANSIQQRKTPRNGQSQGDSPNSRRASTIPITSNNTSGNLVSALSFGFGSASPKPAKLYLTPNQLYFLLSRFEELGVTVGPMNVRLENISSDSTPSEYVSFLAQTKRPKGRSADQDSLHSVSSIRSIVSTVSSMWPSFGISANSEHKEEKRQAIELEDIRYLYSAFTKIPCLKLVLDHRTRRIKGYEEFPFDTAVPLWTFKNLSALEIIDLDFRSFFGWDRLAEQLRSLTVKRAGIDDLADMLTNVVLDDMDRRRRRSAKTSSPLTAFASPSPALRQAELARTPSGSDSLTAGSPRRSLDRDKSSSETSQRGVTSNIRPGLRVRMNSVRQRRSSSSSSSNPRPTPGTSSSNLLSFQGLPSSKWRFLRHLCVADNALTTIETHSLAPLMQNLQSLDLSSNLFAGIPESLASLTSLRALNLSNCMIESLHSLVRNPLPAITVLNLRGNRLSSLAGIERLPSLERLDLRDNKLRDPSELARLTGMPNFTEVFVQRNPFTKSHSNYRVTIFNLFRQALGYTEDVSIDSTGPGFSERKILADRAIEPLGIPVVKAPFEEDGRKHESNNKTPPPKAKSDVSAGQDAPQTPTKTATNSGRKVVRRRIVDMSQGDSPRTPSLVTTYGGSPDATPSFVTALQSRGTPVEHDGKDEDSEESFSQRKRPIRDGEAMSPSKASSNWPMHDKELPLARPSPRPDLSLSSEQYRRRIETLKQDHGSGWLNALHRDADPFYSKESVTSPGAVS